MSEKSTNSAKSAPEFPREPSAIVDVRPHWNPESPSDIVRAENVAATPAIAEADKAIRADLESKLSGFVMPVEHLTDACCKVAKQAYNLKAPSLVSTACRRLLVVPYVGKRVLTYFRAWGFEVLDDGECTAIKNVKAYAHIAGIMSETCERYLTKPDGTRAPKRVKRVTIMNCRIKSVPSEKTDAHHVRFEEKDYAGLMVKALESARDASGKQYDKYKDKDTAKDEAVYFLKEKNMTGEVLNLLPNLIDQLLKGRTVRELQVAIDSAEELK